MFNDMQWLVEKTCKVIWVALHDEGQIEWKRALSEGQFELVPPRWLYLDPIHANVIFNLCQKKRENNHKGDATIMIHDHQGRQENNLYLRSWLCPFKFEINIAPISIQRCHTTINDKLVKDILLSDHENLRRLLFPFVPLKSIMIHYNGHSLFTNYWL